MRIYKILLLIFIFSTLTFSQSLEGIKICIDPGHGGHDTGNDRYMPVPDFWESEGNFSKAWQLEGILTSLGATVIVTRDGNSDSDDLGLSVRAGIANSNNVDLFHSIHSNGWQGNSNYSLTLFRGTDSAPIFPAAKTYALTVYREFEKTNHVVDRSDNARGITTFYGSDYLGVIRPLTMPGILSEGSFHDYIPEGWRLKNEQYLRHEAWAITRSLLTHFGGGAYSTGNLAGILRDPFVTVPSTYKAISELNDSKKAVNYVKATLEPGGLVYNGDDQNNGYYYFENLTPGQYTLYFEAENYALDSATVTIVANQSTFLNTNLALVPNENNPNVVLSFPTDQTIGFSNSANIEIQFDINMDESHTEAAFSITPSVAGSFSWEDNQKRLIFNPTSNLTAGETYQVAMSNSAQTIFEKNLLAEYSFEFTTRAKLNLLSVYPADGEISISQSVQVRLQFDHAIYAPTLAGNISFDDSEGNFVSLAVDQAAYAKGMIAFVPTSKLVNGASYTVVLGEGIGDTEGVTFQENIEIVFTVDAEEYFEGELVDDFETTGNWNSPLENSSSVGLDINSSFDISMTKKYSGNYSGKVDYSFSGTDGYYKISRVNTVSVGSNTETNFGLWICGDLSANLIEYWFSDSESNLLSIEVDTLNFTGWKMKSVKLADIASGELKFEGLGIKHHSSADSDGIIYVDNAQYDFSTPVNNEISEMPIEYSLSQNYPNPFNPSTIIEFALPTNGNVTLKVFNIIGQLVKELVNKDMSAGYHSINFDASNLSTGIYFYKISSGNFSKTNKMMLLK
ncbi:MAG: Ig-like domain-containing protein [Melioribacteraceae bacterium]|jgi:N-acetylmuramoyl-L-alanine amidase|nr:Ig-like domain-containing protein [Melioribacteraceae bacterium]